MRLCLLSEVPQRDQLRCVVFVFVSLFNIPLLGCDRMSQWSPLGSHDSFILTQRCHAWNALFLCYSVTRCHGGTGDWYVRVALIGGCGRFFAYLWWQRRKWMEMKVSRDDRVGNKWLWKWVLTWQISGVFQLAVGALEWAGPERDKNFHVMSEAVFSNWN